ncbi:MAG: LolA family protein [Acetobacteraceae bacterium]
MRRRDLLALAPLLVPLYARAAVTPAPLTPSDRADLARITAYLNGIKTLKAKFLQIAPNGAASQGTVWLERPGRMRFQYDPPSPYLLVAGHGLLIFHDSSLDQTTNIPLASTPLGLLLARRVELSGKVTVTRFVRQAGEIDVTLVRTASPRQGSLTLTFSTPPLRLRQWAVRDAEDKVTRVTLYDVVRGGKFKQDLFSYVPPPRRNLQ